MLKEAFFSIKKADFTSFSFSVWHSGVMLFSLLFFFPLKHEVLKYLWSHCSSCKKYSAIDIK